MTSRGHANAQRQSDVCPHRVTLALGQNEGGADKYCAVLHNINRNNKTSWLVYTFKGFYKIIDKKTFGGNIMNYYYTIEIMNIRFGNVRYVTVSASSRQQAVKQAIVGIGERIVAAWEL